MLVLGCLGAAHAQEPALPAQVWIQAYQENFKADSVPDIVAHARNSYVLLDAFDSEAARAAIPQIKKNGNIVSLYMSVGTGEMWRNDFELLKPFLVKKTWGQWKGEYFVDQISDGLIEIMKKRIDQMAAWGADMVEFDNMDWAFDDANRRRYKFKVTVEEAIAYYQALCTYARSRGLQCMAKSTTRGAEDFAGVTYESSPDEKQWWPQKELQDFLAQGKIGIVVHYNEKDPDAAVKWYRDRYGKSLRVIIESVSKKRYVRPEAATPIAPSN